MDWQEEKHVPVSCLWTVAVVAFYLAILQFKISSLCRLTDHGRTAICSKSLARRTKPREEQWCVGRGLFDGVSILWVAHPIVVHGPGVRRRVRTSEVRVSRRSAVLHRLGPSALVSVHFVPTRPTDFVPYPILVSCCWCWCSSFHCSD